MKIRRLPDWSGSCLIKIRAGPDRSGCCLISIWQLPDFTMVDAWSIRRLPDFDQAAAWSIRQPPDWNQAAAWSIRTPVREKSTPKWIDGKVQKTWKCHWNRSKVITHSSTCKKKSYKIYSILVAFFFFAIGLSIHFLDTSCIHFCDTWSVHPFHIEQNSLKKIE